MCAATEHIAQTAGEYIEDSSSFYANCDKVVDDKRQYTTLVSQNVQKSVIYGGRTFFRPERLPKKIKKIKKVDFCL